MCLSTFHVFIFLFTFSLMLFHPKLFWVHDMGWGWGVFICGHGHRAKKWRTVGQNVTYAGLKSDVRAKMQHWSVIIKGLRPVLEGFVVTMHEGACETRKLNPEGVSPRDLTYCSHKPECIVTTNPDRSVLITIITWHFQFHPVNVGILHLKYDHRARSESCFACYSHCYVTWYPLTTGIVTSQCPSARDAVLVTRNLTPFISACLNSILRFLPQ